MFSQTVRSLKLLSGSIASWKWAGLTGFNRSTFPPRDHAHWLGCRTNTTVTKRKKNPVLKFDWLSTLRLTFLTLWLDGITVEASVKSFFAQWHCGCVSGHVELKAAWPLLASRWEEPRKPKEPHSCTHGEENDHLHEKHGLSPWNPVPVRSKSGNIIPEVKIITVAGRYVDSCWEVSKLTVNLTLLSKSLNSLMSFIHSCLKRSSNIYVSLFLNTYSKIPLWKKRLVAISNYNIRYFLAYTNIIHIYLWDQSAFVLLF